LGSSSNAIISFLSSFWSFGFIGFIGFIELIGFIKIYPFGMEVIPPERDGIESCLAGLEVSPALRDWNNSG
jgi:hypothetical protein